MTERRQESILLQICFHTLLIRFCKEIYGVIDMRMYDLIEKKRDGGRLTKDEIDFIINGYVDGIIPDYQISAWLMAVFFVGMDDEEILNLTQAMAHSGDMVDLSPIEGIKVDKHSTGGVGDKTTLIVAPIVVIIVVIVTVTVGLLA